MTTECERKQGIGRLHELVRPLAIRLARWEFGGTDGIFNSANYAKVVKRILFWRPLLGGQLVIEALYRYPKVKNLGNAHWKAV